MITYKTGDIFKSNAQVITNTVNCVGVMGKGLALAYKTRFPKMFDDYWQRCDRGDVKPGRPYLWEDENIQILNFPTKRHWKQNSLIADIEDGLKYLAENYARMGISSLAIPPLGCGLGGLNWNDVKALIDKHLGHLDDLDVYVYEPTKVKSTLADEDEAQPPTTNKTGGIAAQPSLF